MNKIVKCPHCGEDVEWLSTEKWKPFCSERCRLIDLGDWANETHRIPGSEIIPEEQINESDD